MTDSTNLDALKEERKNVKALLEERENMLRQLNLAKSFKEKNDLQELDVLSSKWREACQQAILQLHSMQPEPKPSLSAMINYWNIDHKMIGYNEEEESFE